MAEADGAAAGFALFFHTYSTFLARPGLYLEDLFVEPRFRGLGIGRRLMVHLARLAVERGCGRFEWAVLTGTPRRSPSTAASARSAWTTGPQRVAGGGAGAAGAADADAAADGTR